jgi:hypothetical protein
MGLCLFLPVEAVVLVCNCRSILKSNQKDRYYTRRVKHGHGGKTLLSSVRFHGHLAMCSLDIKGHPLMTCFVCARTAIYA